MVSREQIRLDALLLLNNDWDSYGGLAANRDSVERARLFVREFLDAKPNISLTPNGNVVIEGNGGVTLEFGYANGHDEIYIDTSEIHDG